MSKIVEKLSVKDIDSYINLISEVFDYKPSVQSIKKLMKASNILIIKDYDDVVASVVVEKKHEYIKEKDYYFISYLCVKNTYRRVGYATTLFDEIEKMAKEENIKYIELTSGNHRRNAHFFYKSKNFKIKDTTVFVKIYE